MSQELPTLYALSLIEHAESICIAIDKNERWKPTDRGSKTDEMLPSVIDRNSPLFAARVKAFQNQLQASANRQAAQLHFGNEIRLWPFVIKLDSKV